MYKCVMQSIATTLRWHRLLCVLLCAVTILWRPAGANGRDATSVLTSNLQAGPVMLSDYLMVLHDPTQKMNFRQVQNEHLDPHFTLAEGTLAGMQSLNFGMTRDAIWLRLHIRNDQHVAVDCMLELGNASLQQVDVYSGNGRHLSTGYGQPFSTRAHKNRHFVFPLTLAPQSGQTVYVRLQSVEPMEIPARLWSVQGFRSHERDEYAMLAMFFGLVLALTIFILLLYSILRDPNYLLFGLFACGVGLTEAANSGIGMEFLWPDAPRWAACSTLVCASLSTATLIQLMRRMLVTAKQAPRLDRVLQLAILVHLFLPLLAPFSTGTLLLPALLVHCTSALLILFTSLLCSLKRQHHAYFFIAAFGVMFVSVAVTTLRSFNLLDYNGFTDIILLPGAAIQLLLLAFALIDRVNIMRHEKAQAQAASYSAQEKLVENLKTSERVLEQHVRQRTSALSDNHIALMATHGELNTAYQNAKISHQLAQEAKIDAARALEELRSAQIQLVQLEKMAALGQLIASVAHEINTPIGAVKSSGRTIADTLSPALSNLVKLFQTLDEASLPLFIRLCNQGWQPANLLSAREERALTRDLSEQLEQLQVGKAREMANVLVQLNAHASVTEFLPLLHHHQAPLILASANCMATIIKGINNINTAVERVGKIVFALNSFTREEQEEEARAIDLQDGIESILHIYQSQIKQGVELKREYEPVPPLVCFADQLNQVWTNLIHNALQAMNKHGTLSIGIRRHGDEIEVAIGDSGCGIPEAHQDKIFEPFFTTKAAGEGSGLGLSIVRKIIDHHRGRIAIRSAPRRGTTVSVFLPLGKESA